MATRFADLNERVLGALREGGPQSAGALAEALHADATVVVRTLARLYKRRLVRRDREAERRLRARDVVGVRIWRASDGRRSAGRSEGVAAGLRPQGTGPH